MNIKRILALILVFIFVFSFSACRRRIVSDENADIVLNKQLEANNSNGDTDKNQDIEINNIENDNISDNGTENDRGEQNNEVENPNSKPNSTGKKGNVSGSSAGTKVDIPNKKIENGITVQLNTNGGVCATNSVLVEPGKTYGSLPTPARRGYSFTGWYSKRVGGNQITAGSSLISNSEHTIYAHWEARSGLTLTFNGNGGRVKSSESNKEVFTGETYGTLPTPLREGYNFLGWYTAQSSGTPVTPSTVYTSNTDQTIYAHWEYDAVAYWQFVLKDINASMYSCQKKSIYVEYDENNTVVKQCALISVTGSDNIAANTSDTTKTDAWVLEKNPNLILKVVSNYGAVDSYYSEMAARFPGKQIIIAPSTAVNGNDMEKLYYQLYFYKLIYPDWCSRVDINKMSSELSVIGSIKS